MSIVGPRPERPFFVDQFNQKTRITIYVTMYVRGLLAMPKFMGSMLLTTIVN